MIFLTEGQQIDKSGYLDDPPIRSFYNVGGHRLFLDCSGSGSPSVVFIPAAGMVGLDYLNIHHEISQYATSVIYDRAGTGWRSEEHTSELQSRGHLVCRLLLE